MSIEEAPFDDIWRAMSTRKFDAVLLEYISGPSLFRLYQVWHSGTSFNAANLGSPGLDASFDQVRYAANDAEYRGAVANLQRVTAEDPPAIFLAWSERARAVSRRFDVAAEPGRDILTTLRLWRPTNAMQYVDRN